MDSDQLHALTVHYLRSGTPQDSLLAELSDHDQVLRDLIESADGLRALLSSPAFRSDEILPRAVTAALRMCPMESVPLILSHPGFALAHNTLLALCERNDPPRLKLYMASTHFSAPTPSEVITIIRSVPKFGYTLATLLEDERVPIDTLKSWRRKELMTLIRDEHVREALHKRWPEGIQPLIDEEQRRAAITQSYLDARPSFT